MAPELIVLPERFWNKVDRSGGPDACWNWLGALGSSDGRPIIKWQGEPVYAYRLSLAASLGLELEMIPTARHVVCDNPRCVNPAHLCPATHVQNMADLRESGRARNGTTAKLLGHTSGPDARQRAIEARGAAIAASRWEREESLMRNHLRDLWAA